MTTWQGEQLLDACVRCDLTPANTRQGGEGTNCFGNRIDYGLIEQRRLSGLRLVRVGHYLGKRIRHTPSKSDHYPVPIRLGIPP